MLTISMEMRQLRCSDMIRFYGNRCGATFTYVAELVQYEARNLSTRLGGVSGGLGVNFFKS